MDDASESSDKPDEQVVLPDDYVKRNNRTSWIVQGIFLAIVVGLFLIVGLGFAFGK